MQFSRRTPADQHPNALSQALEQLRAAKTDILNLIESNPTRIGLNYPADMLAALDQSRGLHYAPHPFGMPEARQAVCDDYQRRGTTIVPDDVILTSSTSEAYSFLFKLLCDPGDAVLIPRPGYPLFDHLCQLDNVAVASYFSRYDGEWHIDFETLASQITANTRAICVVSPANPTGACLKTNEWQQLNRLCREHTLALIIDEVFADYLLTPPPEMCLTPLADSDALTFCLGGLSKAIGTPQLKLSWIALGGPSALKNDAQNRLEIICDAYLSPNTPVQVALPELLRTGANVRHQIQTRIRHNLDVLQQKIQPDTACTLLPPDGGWYAVIQIPALDSEEAFVLELLQKDHVLMQPGYYFDFPNEAYVVVSLLPEPSLFATGIARFLERIRRKIG